jgi:hypothetical protein
MLIRSCDLISICWGLNFLWENKVQLVVNLIKQTVSDSFQQVRSQQLIEKYLKNTRFWLQYPGEERPSSERVNMFNPFVIELHAWSCALDQNISFSMSCCTCHAGVMDLYNGMSFTSIRLSLHTIIVSRWGFISNLEICPLMLILTVSTFFSGMKCLLVAILLLSVFCNKTKSHGGRSEYKRYLGEKPMLTMQPCWTVMPSLPKWIGTNLWHRRG